MRDLALFGALLVVAPLILAHPYIGGLVWVFHGLFGPQGWAFGFARSFPFAMLIAALTLAGMVLSRDAKQWKGGAASVALLLLTAWTVATTFAAPLEPAAALDYLTRASKIFFMTFVLLMVLNSKRHVDLLMWVIALSVAFYGVKGGVFTVLTGGHYLVYGPASTVMENTNHIAVGLVMTVPLLFHLYQQSSSRWIRIGLVGTGLLCVAAVFGSYSRGALLAVIAMGALLWARGSHKLPIFLGVFVTVAALVPFMPDQWEERMRTIETYTQDASAMGRLIAWETAYNIAKDKFPLGGGFEYQSERTSARYSPDANVVLVAHSAYFQVLGSQGFVGLLLFLFFWTLTWLKCSRIRAATAGNDDLRWARSLASMTQVSLVGYFVGAAFIDIAFWDMPYYLFTAVATTEFLLLAPRRSTASAGPPEACAAG